MIDSLLVQILTTLDLVVFERLPNGVFARVGTTRPPSWFTRVFLDAAGDEPITIAEALPFLAHFLSEAEHFWRAGHDACLRSDLFVVPDPSGGEIPLVASAVVVGHRHFLIIQVPIDFDQRRDVLQRARENVLEHEEHVRQTRSLLTPVERVQQLAEQLTRSGLTPEQHEIARALADQLAAVVASVETLAPLSKGVVRPQGA